MTQPFLSFLLLHSLLFSLGKFLQAKIRNGILRFEEKLRSKQLHLDLLLSTNDSQPRGEGYVPSPSARASTLQSPSQTSRTLHGLFKELVYAMPFFSSASTSQAFLYFFLFRFFSLLFSLFSLFLFPLLLQTHITLPILSKCYFPQTSHFNINKVE